MNDILRIVLDDEMIIGLLRGRKIHYEQDGMQISIFAENNLMCIKGFHYNLLKSYIDEPNILLDVFKEIDK